MRSERVNIGQEPSEPVADADIDALADALPSALAPAVPMALIDGITPVGLGAFLRQFLNAMPSDEFISADMLALLPLSEVDADIPPCIDAGSIGTDPGVGNEPGVGMLPIAGPYFFIYAFISAWHGKFAGRFMPAVAVTEAEPSALCATAKTGTNIKETRDKDANSVRMLVFI